MRNIAIISFWAALTAMACTSQQSITGTRTGSNIIVKQEGGDEYEITIIDPGFDRWFITNGKPASYYSLAYYEQQNRRYVISWNEKVSQQAYYRSPYYPFENRIDYDPTIHYGLEVNYKLYYYFKYIEDVYGARYNFPV